MDQPISNSPPPLIRWAETEQTPRRTEGDDSFRSVFHGLSAELDRGKATIDASLQAHGQLNSTQLLALQAAMYRYTEAVELVTKVVDKTSNAVRTTMQSQ